MNLWHNKFVQAEINILSDIMLAELAFHICITRLMSISVNIRLGGYDRTKNPPPKKSLNVLIRTAQSIISAIMYSTDYSGD